MEAHFMSKQNSGINTFQRYLSVWVILCMAAGVLILAEMVYPSD